MRRKLILKLGLILEKKLAEILPKKSLCSLHDRAFGDLCSRLRRSFPHILCNFSAFGALFALHRR